MKRHIECPRQCSMMEPDVLNPFFHRLHLSTLDVIKVQLLGYFWFSVFVKGMSSVYYYSIGSLDLCMLPRLQHPRSLALTQRWEILGVSFFSLMALVYLSTWLLMCWEFFSLDSSRLNITVCGRHRQQPSCL